MTNQMRFFKNGKDQGIAYSGKDLPSGVYFPAVSLYMKVSEADFIIKISTTVSLTVQLLV